MLGTCTWMLGCSTLLLLGPWQVEGYASGHFTTDYSACMFMAPSHGPSASTAPAPYQITVSPTFYTPGSTIQVTISNIGTATQPFRGFIMQPQQVANPAVRVGDFTAVSGTHLTCSGRGGHTISHNINTAKNSLTFMWTAPAAAMGDFHFKMTIVQTKPIFWMNVKSPLITAGAPITTTTIGTTTTTIVGTNTTTTMGPPTTTTVRTTSTTTVGSTTISQGSSFKGAMGILHFVHVFGLAMTLIINNLSQGL